MKFMIAAFGNSAHKITDAFFVCTPCTVSMFGAYKKEEDGKNEIILCANHIPRQETLEETMLHELIHAYDDARAEIDFNNVKHRACTEVCD